jgi:hypothetical protein
MVSLVDLLSSTYGPVQTTILPYLDIADIINLTRTCEGHPVLKHQYITLGDDVRNGEDEILFYGNGRRIRNSYYGRKCEELKDRLNELTMIELTKLSADDRPDNYSQLLSSLDGANDILVGKNVNLPDTWLFYDDKVITFLDKAWKVQQQIDAREEAKRKADFEKLL